MGVDGAGRIRKYTDYFSEITYRLFQYFRTLSAITQSLIVSKPWENLTRGHGHDALCQMNACYFIIMCDKPSVGG